MLKVTVATNSELFKFFKNLEPFLSYCKNKVLEKKISGYFSKKIADFEIVPL